MFRILACRKNIALHTQYSNLDAPHSFPFQQIHSEYIIFKNKIPPGFKSCALPKIIPKIYDTIEDKQIIALNTIFDELKESKCSMKNLNLFLHLKILLKQSINKSKGNGEAVIVSVCRILILIAEKKSSALENIFNEQLIYLLLNCIEMSDNDARLAASLALKTASEFQRIDMNLMDEKLLLKMKSILMDRQIENEYLYSFLASILQLTSEIGVKQGYFDFLLNKIHLRAQHLPAILKCFAMLINNQLGQELCDIFVIVRVLNDILCEKNLKIETYEFAAMALQHCSHSFVSRMMIVNYDSLLDALVSHAKNRDNVSLQIYCLQRQFAENYNTKITLRKKYLHEIVKTSVLSHKAQQIKINLIDCLNYQIF